jgi:transposase
MEIRPCAQDSGHSHPDLAQRFAILTSIPGVPAITAFALLFEMPGALEAPQAASLAGLAPVTRRSDR